MIKITKMVFKESNKIKEKMTLISSEEFYTKCIYFTDVVRICEEDTDEQLHEIKCDLNRSLPFGSYEEHYLYRGVLSDIPDREKQSTRDRLNKGYVVIGTELFTSFYLSHKDDDVETVHNYTIRYTLHHVE